MTEIWVTSRQRIRVIWCQLMEFLTILYDKGMLYIETGNSFSKKLNKDREGKIRSTKKDSDWHGIGLRAIEEIVKKYNGDMIITDENNYFTVKIIMEM